MKFTDRVDDERAPLPGRSPLHGRTGTALYRQAGSRGFAAPAEPATDDAVETGTTIVGVTAADAVVLAADRRASLGGRLVTNKSVRKVDPIHPTAAVALSGAVGHLDTFVRTMRTEATLYEDRRGEPMTMTALSTLAGNLLRSQPLRVTPILGGVDADGTHLYGIDGAGGVLDDEYTAGGSGTQLAYGVLERDYDPDATVGEARSVAAEAVETASERDTASGNGLTVATVTADGVEMEAFEAGEEVA
jgi:proteasome beta subunit